MSDINHSQRSIADLIGDLANDITGLFRKEVQLAKTEASEKLDQVVDASQGLAVGAVLAIGAVGVFLAALVTGLSALLVVGLGMDDATANFIASLVVAVVVGGIAWAFIQRSLSALKASRLNLNRTAHSLARDAEVVKESI